MTTQPPIDPSLTVALVAALRHPHRGVRRAALRALVHLPLDDGAWLEVSGYILHALPTTPPADEPAYPIDRSDLIDAAAFVPTFRVRQRLLDVASSGIDAERARAIEALVKARESGVVPILLRELGAAAPDAKTWLWELLSACDLGDLDLPEHAGTHSMLGQAAATHEDADVRFWLSLALARSGHAELFIVLLREIAEQRLELKALRGSPFRFVEELYRRRPYPDPMRELFKRVARDRSHPLCDICGDLVEQLQAQYVSYTRQAAPETDDPAAARAHAAAIADELERNFAATNYALASVDTEALRHVDPARARGLVNRLFAGISINLKRPAAGIGNDVAQLIATLGAVYDPDVTGLFEVFVSLRHASFDVTRDLSVLATRGKDDAALPATSAQVTDVMHQIAWAAARNGLEPVLRSLEPALRADDASLCLAAAEFAEYAAIYAGVFHPPMFGAGPGVPEAQPLPVRLIDDRRREGQRAKPPSLEQDHGSQAASLEGDESPAEVTEASVEPASGDEQPEKDISRNVLLYPWREEAEESSNRSGPVRVVNTGFAPRFRGADELTTSDPLQAGAVYYFWIDVDVPQKRSIETTPTPLPREHLPAEARLVVVLFGFPNELEIFDGADVGEWLLHADGSVTVIRQPERQPFGVPDELARRRLFFPVNAPNREGKFRLRCNIYHEQVLLQSRLVEAIVMPRAYVIGGALRSTIDYTIGKALDPARLAETPRHRLSIMLNANGDGTHGFRLFGADEQELFKNDATLEGDQLATHVRQARGAMRRAAWGDEDAWVASKRYRYDDALNLARLRQDVAQFAIRGRRFYTAVVSAMSGGRPKADALSKLMRSPGYVQLASKQAARHVVPVALFYDYPFDTNATALDGYELCRDFSDALKSGAPLEEAPCFQGHCVLADNAQNKTTICPSGFWGFRHAIGLPLSVPSVPDPPTKITFHGHPEFAVGVSTDPVFTLRAAHEKRLQALQPTPVWNYGDTRPEVLQLLQRKQTHLVYFYCHGGAAGNVPFLVFGHGEPAITPDNMFEGVYWGDGTRPLVFINGCHTTALDPETALEFVSAFVDNAGAAGVIGTEITVFEPLARVFAEDALKRFLEGVPIGEAVRLSRLALLKAGNPLGLVYIPFVIPGLRLVAA